MTGIRAGFASVAARVSRAVEASGIQLQSQLKIWYGYLSGRRFSAVPSESTVEVLYPCPRLPRVYQRFAYLMHVVPGGHCCFALIPLVVCGYLGWYHYGAKKLDHALYALKLEQIKLTAQPPWISTSVAEEVFQSKRLDRVNLLDPSASASIASAFETHPWVEKTARVQKSQGGAVAVDVIFRKPLAMVKVFYHPTDDRGQASGERKEGFFPVDHKGIILPDGDFKQNQSLVWDYMMIDIDDLEHPSAQPGLPFNDIRVLEALKLISYLEKNCDSRALGLQWVHVRAEPRLAGSNPWLLEVWSTDKHLITWGHAPGHEIPGEDLPERKLANLTAWLQVQRSSGSSSGTLNLMDGRASNSRAVSASVP